MHKEWKKGDKFISVNDEGIEMLFTCTDIFSKKGLLCFGDDGSMKYFSDDELFDIWINERPLVLDASKLEIIANETVALDSKIDWRMSCWKLQKAMGEVLTVMPEYLDSKRSDNHVYEEFAKALAKLQIALVTATKREDEGFRQYEFILNDVIDEQERLNQEEYTRQKLNAEKYEEEKENERK